MQIADGVTTNAESSIVVATMYGSTYKSKPSTLPRNDVGADYPAVFCG